MTDAKRRSGLPTWMWILIGCGSLVFLLMVAGGALVWWGFGKARDLAADLEANPGLTAARLVIKAHPEVEEVAVDEERGTITVRNTTTGEIVTVDFEEASQGRLSFSSGDRKVTIEAEEGGEGSLKITTEGGELTLSGGDRAGGERPDWVILYPGAEVTTQHALRHDTGVGGGVELRTEAAVEAVSEYYRRELDAAGFPVSVASFSGDDGGSVMITGADEAEGRTLVVNIRREAEVTVVALTFNLDRKDPPPG